MGILSGLLGNASEEDVDKVEEALARILSDGERIEKAFRVIRDMIVFTDRRLLLINRQGSTGKKTEFHSIPYRQITHFSVETAGYFDLDTELKVWVSGTETPIEHTFRNDRGVYDVQRALAAYVLA